MKESRCKLGLCARLLCSVGSAGGLLAVQQAVRQTGPDWHEDLIMPPLRETGIARGAACKTQKIADITLIALFLLAIYLPMADTFFGLDQSSAPVEKRRLAEKPKLSWCWDAIDGYPKRFEAYFNDYFGFRNELVHWYNSLKVAWLGTVSSPKVMEGKEGWLFYTGDRVIEHCCRATVPFSERQLASWQQILEKRQDWLAQSGIRFLLVIVPNKHTVYAEYLPNWIVRVGEKTRLDQFVEYMREHSKVEFLDLRDALLEAKKGRWIYYRADSHWNSAGAFVGYQEIMSRLSKWFPAAKPLSESDFIYRPSTRSKLDLAILLGQYGSIKEETLVMSPKRERLAHRVGPGVLLTTGQWERREKPMVYECRKGQISRAVMFHDSMVVGLIPFLSEHFARIVYIWQDHLDAEIVEFERPNLVIQEVTERLLTKTQTLTNQMK